MGRTTMGLALLLAGLHTALTAQGAGPGEGSREGVVLAPEFSLGWLEDSRGGSWTLRRQASTSVARWDRSGWWLEARTGLRLDPDSDLLLSGGWFLAQPASGVWHASPAAMEFTFNVPSYQWGTVDVLYRHRALQGRLALLSGVRWDKKKTRVRFSDNTDDDYCLNTYAPILGIQLEQPAAGGVLTLGALGSPLLRGQMKYKYQDHTGGFVEYGDFSLRRGHTVECRVQYTRSIGSRWRLGGFVQWATQRVTSEEAALSGNTAEPVSWRVSHQAWTLGATAAF